MTDATSVPNLKKREINMRDLNIQELESVEGGVFHAVWAGMVLYNALSASQIAFGAGVAVGFGATVAAAMD